MTNKEKAVIRYSIWWYAYYAGLRPRPGNFPGAIDQSTRDGIREEARRQAETHNVATAPEPAHKGVVNYS